MFRFLATLLVVAAAVAPCGPAFAQRVTAVVSQDSVRIGERFLLTIAALHPFDQAPGFPNPRQGSAAFGDLEAFRVVSSGYTSLGPRARVDSVVYDVTTFALDSAVIPPLKVSFDASNVEDSTRRLVIPVVSVVPADADTIRAMAEAVRFLKPDQRTTPPWPWILLGLAALAALGTLWYWYTRRRTQTVVGGAPSQPQLSPYDQAMARLNKLEDAKLDAKGSELPYFVELSDAVRTYVERRIGIPALELTTSELLDQFTIVRYKIPGGTPDAAQQVLGLSDLVKFAEHVPPEPDSRKALERTKRLVDRLEAKQRQLELDAARQEQS